MHLCMFMRTQQGKACNTNVHQSASQNPTAKVPCKNSQALGGEGIMNVH